MITGVNGFVGTDLMRNLGKTDCELIPILRRSAGFKNEVIIDFCNPNFYSVIKRLPKVDAIIHLGAKVDFNIKDMNAFFEPNILATAQLANWANKIDAHFIFASSAIIFGTKNSRITLESKPDPDTNYGYSKWLAEEIIRASGVKYTILRIAGVFGKGGPSHLGINKAINDALKGVIPVQYGTGKIKRNYIYVKDLSKIIEFCIERKIKGTHFVSGSSINTISEMLQLVCDVILPGRKPEYRQGTDGHDIIIEHSAHLPKGRSFEEAIRDIK